MALTDRDRLVLILNRVRAIRETLSTRKGSAIEQWLAEIDTLASEGVAEWTLPPQPPDDGRRREEPAR